MKNYLSFIIVRLLMVSAVEAQEPGYLGADETNKWSASIYMWGMGIDGTIGLGPLDAPVDVSFTDILDDLEFAAFGHLEYNADNNFGVFTDIMFVGIGSTVPTDFGSVNVDMDMLVVEGALSYNLASRESPFNLFAGFRYWDVELDTVIHVDAPPAETSASGSVDWTDFMFGGRLASATNGGACCGPM